MKTLFVKFYIGLFLVLLSGYGKAYAHTDMSNYSLIENADITTHVGFAAANQNCADTFYKAVLKQTFRQLDKIDPTDNEEEEDELSQYKVYSKKFSPAVNYAATAWYKPIAGIADTRTEKTTLPQREVLLHIPSGRWYIFFGVFRI